MPFKIAIIVLTFLSVINASFLPTRESLLIKINQHQNYFKKISQHPKIANRLRQQGQAFPPSLLGKQINYNDLPKQPIQILKTGNSKVDQRLQDFPGTDVYFVSFWNGNDATAQPNIPSLPWQNLQSAINYASVHNPALSIVAVLADASIHGPVDLKNVSVNIASPFGAAAVVLGPLVSSNPQPSQSIILTSISLVSFGTTPFIGIFNLTVVRCFLSVEGSPFFFQNIWFVGYENSIGMNGLMTNIVTVVDQPLNPFLQNTAVQSVDDIFVLFSQLFFPTGITWFSQFNNGNLITDGDILDVEFAFAGSPQLLVAFSNNSGPAGQSLHLNLGVAFDLNVDPLPTVVLAAGYNGNVRFYGFDSRRFESGVSSSQSYVLSQMTGTSTFECMNALVGRNLLTQSRSSAVQLSYSLTAGQGTQLVSGGMHLNLRSVAIGVLSNYTVMFDDYTVVVTSIGYGAQVVFGNFGGNDFFGKVVVVKKMDDGPLKVTSTTGTVDGAPSVSLLGSHDAAQFQSDGVNWYRISNL